MANLKIDLVNKLNNDKMFDELELVRLAQDPTMNYKAKIEQMDFQLGQLALLNAKIGLVEQYFQEPAPQAAPQATPEAPKAQVHQGQSHGE